MIDEERIAIVVRLLRERTGAEHAVVQPDVIAAAVRRRAQATRTDLDDYFTLAGDDPDEAEHLTDEIFGDATRFFRDPGAFDVLGLARIVADKKDGDPLRLWSIGCASGEEAYSLAMLAREVCDRQKKTLRIRVFASEVRDPPLVIARRSVYPPEAVAKIDDARRARWFVLDKHRGFRVRDELRETVVFSKHDVLQHAPFGKMDVVACRNLLPILREPSRERLLAVLYYALTLPGALLLGQDDELETFSDCFDVVDASARVFQKLPENGDVIRHSLLMSMRLPTPSLAEARVEIAFRHARSREVTELLGELRAAHEAELSALAQLEATQEQLRVVASAYAELSRDQVRLRSVDTSASSGLYARAEPTSGVVSTGPPMERVSETLAATGSGVFGTTRERRVLWSCGRVLGRDKEEAIGENLDALLSQRDVTELAELASASYQARSLARRAVVLTIGGRSTLVEVQVRAVPKESDDTELTWFFHEL